MDTEEVNKKIKRIKLIFIIIFILYVLFCIYSSITMVNDGRKGLMDVSFFDVNSDSAYIVGFFTSLYMHCIYLLIPIIPLAIYKVMIKSNAETKQDNDELNKKFDNMINKK